MTSEEKTWSVLTLAIIILLLVLWMMKKRTATTQTSVTVNPGTAASETTQFPSRNDNNQVMLRICTYDSGAQLTLDPGAVGGHCPPVYTDITGKSGNLTKDEVISIPNAGQATNQVTDYAGGLQPDASGNA